MTNSDYYVDWGNAGKKRPRQHIIGEKAISIIKELVNRSLYFEAELHGFR